MPCPANAASPWSRIGSTVLPCLSPLGGHRRARLAEHDRVDRLEVRRVGQQRQMDLVAVELAVGRGAEVVFDVARAADVGRVGRAAGEFVEDRAVGLAHDVGEDVEPAAVGHADGDLADAHLAAIFDHRLERRDRAFAAVEAEALGADIFLGEEFLPLLGLDHLGEDRLLALGGELDGVVGALDPLLDEAPLLQVVDVHIFEADVAAVGRLQHRDDLADASPARSRARRRVDRAVEVGVGEAVIGRASGRPGSSRVVQAERIELGGEMPAHAIGADQHHRPDASRRRRGGSRRGRRRPLRPCRGLTACGDLLDRLASVGSSPRLSSSSSATGQFGRAQLGPGSRSIG